MFGLLGDARKAKGGALGARLVTGAVARLDALLLLAAAGVAFALLRLFEGDRVAEDAFLGPDGRLFTSYVTRFPDLWDGALISRYAIWRALPVSMVHRALVYTHAPMETAHVVLAQTALNAALSVGSAALLLSSLRRLGVSQVGRVLGLSLLVFSYPFLKQPTYHAAVIDGWALFASFALVRAYLSRSRVAICAVVAAAIFTWPYLFVYLGGPLIAFLPRDERPTVPEGSGQGVGLTLGVTFAVLAVALLAALSLADYDVVSQSAFPDTIREWGFYPKREGYKLSTFKDFWHLASPVVMKSWLPLSAALLIVTFATPALALARGASVRDVLRAARPETLILAGVTIVLAQKYAEAHSEPLSHTESPIDKVRIQISLGLTRPLLPTVAHFAFLGPMVAAIVAYFRPFIAAVKRMGMGYRLVAILSFGLLVLSETRQQIPVFAILLVPLVKAIDEEGARLRSVAVVAAVGLVTSKVLFPWESHDPRAWLGSAWKRLPPTFLEWPLQRHYMSIGPVMGQKAYQYYLVGLLVTALALYLLRARGPAREPSAAGLRVVAALAAIGVLGGAVMLGELAVRGRNVARHAEVTTPKGSVPELVNGVYEEREPFVGAGVGDAVTLDLGREVRVWDVAVYGGAQACAESAPARLLVGTDPSHMRLASWRVDTFSYLTPWRTRLFGERARFVRVELANGERLRLSEIEVHGR